MTEKAKKPAVKKETTPKLVKMAKGDKVAMVHPDEVENYKSGGYQ